LRAGIQARENPHPERRVGLCFEHQGRLAGNAGRFAVRQQLSNLLNGVPLSIWYDWKNDGQDPADGEQNFGTVKDDLQPKPAYTALKTMTDELKRLPAERDWKRIVRKAISFLYLSIAPAIAKSGRLDSGGSTPASPEGLLGDFRGAWAAAAICYLK
jgi:hypothetical protein